MPKNAAAEVLKEKSRFFIVPVEIFDVPDITMAEQMVLMVLQSFVNKKAAKATVFPSYRTIARKSRMSERNAYRVIQSLISKGLIDKNARFIDTPEGRKRQISNLYTLHKPREAAVSTLSSCQVSHDTVTPTPLTSRQETPDTVADKQNHLSKPEETNLMNNQESKESVVVEYDRIRAVLAKKKVKVNQNVIQKWRQLADEETILMAIEEAFSKRGVSNVVGYVSGMLANGYQATAKAHNDLPEWVVKQIENKGQPGTHQELTEEQKKEARDLLKALGEID